MKTLTLVRAAAIGAILQVVAPQIALAETLKISTFVPPKHAFNRMLQAWGDELAEKSGGDLTVEIFPAGQLGPTCFFNL